MFVRKTNELLALTEVCVAGPSGVKAALVLTDWSQGAQPGLGGGGPGQCPSLGSVHWPGPWSHHVTA